MGAAYIYDGVTDRDGIGTPRPTGAREGEGAPLPVVNGAAATLAHVFGPIAMPLLTVGAAVASRRARPAGEPA